MSATTDHEQYKWLDAHAAILQRPDTHLGPVSVRTVDRVVLDVNGAAHRVQCQASPALFKIFDEIVTNAIDHRERDDGMTSLRISIEADGSIHVLNDGAKTITTTDWPGTAIPTPQVLFHELHAGSNLADANAHNVGGRNGVGATVTNLFSAWFEVRVHNPDEGIAYLQRFEQNASQVGTPHRTKYRNKGARTSISFLPDYARLGMQPPPLSDDVRALLTSRAIDAAACTPANVYVNGAKLPIKTLRHYALAHGGEPLGADETTPASRAQSSAQVVVTTAGPLGAVHVCFVNGVRCSGTLLDAVFRQIVAAVHSKAPGQTHRQLATLVGEHVSVFVAARINTPSFGSQSKDALDTPVSQFGFTVPECTGIAKKIERLDVVQMAVQQRRALAEGKQARKTLRESNRGRNVAKYERATDLGKTKQPCTLFLTEGDSAKAMVVAGFSAIGRRYNGVFPLKGKPLNAHDTKAADVLKNEELANLISILGLDPPSADRVYDAVAVRKLPYAHLMIMTDQDHDGSHIMGLILALFVRYYPSLLRAAPRFLRRFVTPVIKVRPPHAREALEFFSVAAHDRWEHAQRARGIAKPAAETNYYKGLGTSTSEEALAYFSALDTYTVDVHWDDDGTAIRECFGKGDDSLAARRGMLRAVDPHACVDYSGTSVAMTDFCRRELVHFFAADNVRSIPSLVDGFKPSQRKVFFEVRKSLTKHKVAQLSGEVAKSTVYHHGEASLANVIVNMAQTFVGSNNLNLLVPKGQFGNRHGEKPAAPRYIFTQLAPLARLIYCPEDDAILELLEDEGQRIEPRFYVPILPMILVNGADGIGTGFATTVPPHSPLDVLERCRMLCEPEACEETTPLEPLTPWVRGFGGIVDVDEAGVTYTGLYEVEARNPSIVLRITELPPGQRTNDVKAHLQAHAMVDEVVSHSRHDCVDLRVAMTASANLSDATRMLKLRTRQSTTKMHAFNAAGKLTHYATTLDLLRAHARVRLEAYATRLAAIKRALDAKRALLQAKIDYALAVQSGAIEPAQMRRSTLLARLGPPHAEALVAMTCSDLTLDAVDERRGAMAALDAEVARVCALTPRTAWRADLDRLERALLDEGYEHQRASTGARLGDAEEDADGTRPAAKRSKVDAA